MVFITTDPTPDTPPDIRAGRATCTDVETPPGSTTTVRPLTKGVSG